MLEAGIFGFKREAQLIKDGIDKSARLNGCACGEKLRSGNINQSFSWESDCFNKDGEKKQPAVQNHVGDGTENCLPKYGSRGLKASLFK
jgi:hypothetical protein